MGNWSRLDSSFVEGDDPVATPPVASDNISVRIVHTGLRRLFDRGDSRRLNPAHVRRIRRVLADLDVASSPKDLDQPGYRLHLLQGNRRGYWSVRVSANWRIVFRFVAGEAVDVNLVDYH